ncbi:MAG: 4-deoxy-4-formamido-L-arabinose-phosphoundecaprenol deformylase [Rhodocyclaceae bacterium]|nr:4-deoxy-4-formamido-L-arabinose-phosphoundecaprenol deformylase [Rhodocyclaceae bacterium]
MSWRRRHLPPPLALKIDVDTWRGTREGVPALLALLDKFQARATFLFSLGPDHTGRAVRRALRPGFMQKVGRTSVLEHYGLKTLLYGTLLPGPDIGRRGADIMRAVAAAGHETGIHTWDHVRWQDGVEHADSAWTHTEMTRAGQRYEQIFGTPARTHGAAGWQMNRHALRLTQSMGFDYCSDARGQGPFLPIVDAEIVACPQLPTTLPTLDELIGLDGCNAGNVHERLLALTAEPPAYGHVYTLHAELEGGKLAPVFERLLAGWRDQGYALTTTRALYEALEIETLPRCEILRGTVAGRSGTLMVQGAEFLA